MAYFLPQKLKTDFKTNQLLQNSPLNIWGIEAGYVALQCYWSNKVTVYSTETTFQTVTSLKKKKKSTTRLKIMEIPNCVNTIITLKFHCCK